MKRELTPEDHAAAADVTDVKPRFEDIDEATVTHAPEAAGEFLHDGRAINPFRALVTEVLNLHPNPLHVEQRGGIRVYLTNPRRNAERKLVKAHGFRQVKKARQVARYILREQAARQP